MSRFSSLWRSLRSSFGLSDVSDRTFDRKPNEPDARDWQMADHLTANRYPSARTATAPLTDIDAALAAMRAKRFMSKVTLNWAEAVTAYLHGQSPNPPSPPPVPPLPVGAQIWSDTYQLDQGQTGHCVGFGWCQWGNTEPVADLFTDQDGHALYYECKIIDGEPGQENGSQVRSGAKAMKARHRLDAYVFAATVDEIKKWVLTKGPVVIGSNWYTNMMDTDRAGFVHPTGNIEGGHCYVLDGVVPAMGGFRYQNSWGSSWGQNGYFFMKEAEFADLFSQQGDACAALELT